MALKGIFTRLEDRRSLVVGVAALLFLLLVCANVTMSIATPLVNSCIPFEIHGTGMLDSQPLWDYNSSNYVISSPLADQSWVYVRTTQEVQVLDRLTGKQLNSVGSPGLSVDTPPPVIYEDMLFIPQTDGLLTANHRYSLEPAWKVCPRENCVSPGGFTTVATMTYSDGVLVVTRYSNAMTAYDAQTGKVLWAKSLEGSHSYPDVYANGGTLYTGESNSVVGYDIVSGRQTWKVQFEPEFHTGRLLVNGNNLYVVTSSGSRGLVMAVDINSKRTIWEFPIATTQPTMGTYLAVDNSTLIIASDSLVAVDITSGKMRWESDRLPGLKKPVFSSTTIYIRDAGSNLYAFDTVTGKQIGQLDLRNSPPQFNETELNPVVYDNMLIVPMGSTHIVAFELK